MPLPNHVAFCVELAEILAHAADLQSIKRQYQADQETQKILADYPIPVDLASEYAEKQQYFEGELESVLDNLVCKYQETPISTLKCFDFLEGVSNNDQAFTNWTSEICKHLIQLKEKTAKMLRDEEKDSEISKDYDFLAYEQRLKNIYHSVVKFENCLKIRCSPAPLHLSYPRQSSSPLAVQLQPIPDISRPKPNDSDGIVLTERLDNIRNTITTFQTSRPEFSSRLCQIHKKYQLESLQTSPLSQFSNTIHQAVNNIASECLPRLLSTAKSECQQVLADNEEALHVYFGQKLSTSFGHIETVLGVTNAASMSVPEEGEVDE